MAKSQLKTKALYHKLDHLFEASSVFDLNDHKKWVIFSDVHIGDGGNTDDFKRNAKLFTNALEGYYLDDHALILNGDIEELQRFQVHKIYEKWRHVYEIFDHFARSNRFFKTLGNHDLELMLLEELPFHYQLHESIRLLHHENDLFIFHGHQASKKYQEHNELIGFTLKYFANPLGIKSYSVAHNSQKQYKIEKRVYGFSAFRKIVSIIGHTHRPLFESLHKMDRIKYKIEQLCRDYNVADSRRSKTIEEEIRAHKKDLKKYYRENKDHSYQSYVYNTMFHIPCLFNSGCVVGKRGMTCLEIENGKIRLVHWFDKNISKKYLRQSGYMPEQLGTSDFYRMVINEESLDYIFTRIKFLS
jgi:predicted phosphodiesterase